MIMDRRNGVRRGGLEGLVVQKFTVDWALAEDHVLVT